MAMMVQLWESTLIVRNVSGRLSQRNNVLWCVGVHAVSTTKSVWEKVRDVTNSSLLARLKTDWHFYFLRYHMPDVCHVQSFDGSWNGVSKSRKCQWFLEMPIRGFQFMELPASKLVRYQFYPLWVLTFQLFIFALHMHLNLEKNEYSL